MPKKKKNDSNTFTSPDTSVRDPFLRRREVQGTLIRKILAEIDLPSKPEADLKPEDSMNYLNFDREENEKQDV